MEASQAKWVPKKGEKVRVLTDKSKYGRSIDMSVPHTFKMDCEGEAAILAPDKPVDMLVSYSKIAPWVDEIAGTHVMADDTLGVMREFREVKRKAAVGERIKIVDAKYDTYKNGDVLVIVKENSFGPRVATPDGSSVFMWDYEYVVLEPTDIVRIGSGRFKMVERTAQVGEKVIVVSSDHAAKTDKAEFFIVKHSIGTVGVVESRLDVYDRTYVSANGESWYVMDGDLRVLEPVSESPTTPAEVVARALSEDATLASIEHDAIIAVDRLKDDVDKTVGAAYELGKKHGYSEGYAEGLAQGKHDAAVEREFQAKHGVSVSQAYATAAPKPKTPNELRAEIVEQAKEFVENFRHANSHIEVTFVENRESRWAYTQLHVTVGEKRTQVGYGYSGFTKDDTYNSYLAQARTLHIALGLDVPDTYLKAPQPTEAQVGDVFELIDFQGVVRTCVVGNGGVARKFSGYLAERRFGYRIIDDTRDGYVYDAEKWQRAQAKVSAATKGSEAKSA